MCFSPFCTGGAGGALSGMGEALHQVAQARDALGVNVKCTFIDPLQDLHDTDLKEIRVRSVFQVWFQFCSLLMLIRLVLQYQLKKMNSRRLDFDYKKRRSGKVPAGELQQAWGKFVMSKELAERSMFVLLQNNVSHIMNSSQSDQHVTLTQTKLLQIENIDNRVKTDSLSLSDSPLTILGSLKVDHIRVLAALVTALLDFHHSTHHILLGLHGNMQARPVHIQGGGKSRNRIKNIIINLNCEEQNDALF